MKKYFLLILLAGFFTLASCSSDDDGGDSNDNIVGTWVLVGVNPPQLFSVEDCPNDSTITFNSDYSGSGTFYLAANDCEAEHTEGNWSNQNGVYTIEVPVIGSQPGEVEFEGSNRFYFTPQQMQSVTLTFERE